MTQANNTNHAKDVSMEIQRQIIIVSCVITLVDFFICYRHSYMVYMTNDDAGIQNLLNGFTSGANDPAHQFISIFLGFPLTWLYELMPKIQWWFIYSQFLMLVGIFLINYSFLCIAIHCSVKKGKKCWGNVFEVGIILVFNIAFSIPSIASTSFTVVPALYGTGIAALLFYSGYMGRINNRFLLLMLVLFLPVLFHRKNTAYVVLCYLFLVCLYVFVKREKSRKSIWTWAICVLISVATIIAFVGLDTIYKNQLNGYEFAEFNKARAELLDHPRDSYDEHPEIYEAVGWNRDSYVMVSQWCFIDELCNAKNMHYIAANSQSELAKPSEIIKGMIVDTRERYILILSGFISLASIIIIIVYANKQNLLFSLINIAGTLILIGYQIMMGRVLYRSLIVVLLPAFVFESLLGFASKNDASRRMAKIDNTMSISDRDAYIGRLKFCSVMTGVALFLALHFAILQANNFINIKEICTDKYEDNDDTVNQYLITHKNGFYVMQIGIKANVNPRLLYTEDISNSFYWGGSDYYSHVRKRVLRKNGMEKLDDESFLQDNVYIISGERYDSSINDAEKEELAKNSCLYAFCHYMKQLHPEYEMILADAIYEGMNVYHFVENK